MASVYEPPRTDAFNDYWIIMKEIDPPAQKRQQGAKLHKAGGSGPAAVAPQVIYLPSNFYRPPTSADDSSTPPRKRSRRDSTASSSSISPLAAVSTPSVAEWLDHLQKTLPSTHFDSWEALREKFRAGGSFKVQLSTLAHIPMETLVSQ